MIVLKVIKNICLAVMFLLGCQILIFAMALFILIEGPGFFDEITPIDRKLILL